MADCVSLLDEELSSFVFNYLTENSGSQYGEEEVCSDRLDADFPDIDLSQLDASDFDSVNCLSELHWCNDNADISPASIQYSTGDPELFEIEDENAALLAALTDSLDGMVEDEEGGLSVFPSLREGSEEDLPFPSGSLSPETEDPSLLKRLLLSPPNVPTGLESHKEGSSSSVHRHSSRSLHMKPVRPLVKRESTHHERKPRAVRPAGRLCTELHRHLTTTQEAEDTPSADTEEDGEEEEDDDEEDSESEQEEEEEETSSSEGESSTPPEPSKPQFSSEKELHSVVELIKYMHTYCLPMRKQAIWERKERECPGQVRRARPEYPPARISPNCHKAATQAQICAPRPRHAFTRRREFKANSLLRELLETVKSFNVSKPYRLHSPPYTHNRGAIPKAAQDRKTETPSPAARSTKPELRKDSESDRSLEAPKSPDLEDASFSVRRSRRLASFPSRFAKKVRAGRMRVEPVSGAGHLGEEDMAVKHPMGHDLEKDTTTPNNSTSSQTTADTAESDNICCQNVKRSCLCLPLTPISTGETQYANKPFEQTLSVDLCGTAGLTPPTTPPHKPVEDELFKPEGKGESPPKGSWLSRANSRKFPEQTELYAQLHKMGQASDADPKVHQTFGDHDYCLLSLGERRKRTAAMLSHSLFGRSSSEGPEPKGEKALGGERHGHQREDKLFSKVPEYLSNGTRADSKGDGRRATAASPQSGSPLAISPHKSDEEGERSSLCSRSPSPILHSSFCLPHSPSSKPDISCENSETCHGDKQGNKISKSGIQIDEDNCQVFYIHNLPSSVTQIMLRKRFEAFGDPEDCKVITKNEERCGVIKFRQAPSGQQIQKHRREPLFQNRGGGMHRLSRKRYIDLDEAGPGPVKSKYDALDFDTLLKEAQKSLHR
ncbi:peroxisome proliferator-activated receptor gamma coactivator 1-beta [Oncorhynchus kisutch]|uniref:Peroxisome proliferator-activated receptor gamma coactivator 1-beta n=1 Tax=Oncorhynchus kisutch TaxID=8019 RepID=A0A8C7J746_ONCKI|nr:peroxisome proliferator-activated receptor gamma coactivator 1-beta [Oncorhynchus kisutch]